MSSRYLINNSRNPDAARLSQVVSEEGIKGGDSGKKIRQQGPVFIECLLCTSPGLALEGIILFDLHKNPHSADENTEAQRE